jgi:hypothetical protein
MKTLTLKKQESFLNWNTEGLFSYETQHMSLKERRKEIRTQFSKVENVADLLEAYNDTFIFRNEMKILEHGYATASGSNYDKMVVEFRGKKYVINDRENYVVKYNGENGFN